MGYRLGERTTRVLRFLFGLHDPRVVAQLAPYGFTEADRDEGWELLHAMGKGGPPVVPEEAPDVNVVVQIDGWENAWFPIAEAALGRKFPNVRERLFRNLRQVEGTEAIVSVTEFVRRLDELSDPAAPCGADGPRALELLARRGLTQAVIGEAKSLLDSLRRVDRKPWSTTWEDEQARLFAAENELWAWFLDWSRVARVAIKQRALLRQLGFLADSRKDDDEGEPD